MLHDIIKIIIMFVPFVNLLLKRYILNYIETKINICANKCLRFYFFEGQPILSITNIYTPVAIDGNRWQCHFFFFGWKRRLGVFIKLNGFKNKSMSNTIDLLYNVSNNIIWQLCTVNQFVFEFTLLRDLPK